MPEGGSYTCSYCDGTGGRASCPIHGPDAAPMKVKVYGPGFDDALPGVTLGHRCPTPEASQDGNVQISVARPDWTCGECGRVWRWWNGGFGGPLFWWVEVQGPSSVRSERDEVAE